MRVLLFSSFFCCCLQVSAQTSSQRLSFTVTNQPLNKTFYDLSDQTGIDIILPPGRDSVFLHRVTLKAKGWPLDSVLKALTAPYSLSYRIEAVPKGLKISISFRTGHPAPSTLSTSHPFLTIRGQVVDAFGGAVAGVDIKVKHKSCKTTTDSRGEFILEKIVKGDSVQACVTGIDSAEKRVDGTGLLTIHLNHHFSTLGTYVVEMNNGYQKLSKKMGLGSFATIDNTLISRNDDPNVLSRTENLASGVLFARGRPGTNDNRNNIPSLIQIRGISTLNASSAPLTVLDNFPYDGDIRNINPNDIDTIFVLKDAAATSIWGLRAGNGVFVLNTKKGKSPVPQLVYTTSVSLQPRPDLSNLHVISSPDFMDFENYLFEKGYYTGSFMDPLNYGPVTPDVNLLYAKQQGLIPLGTADAQLAAMRKQNVWNDINQRLYQNSINQQHSLQLSGIGSGINYYLSAGYDRDISNPVAAKYERISLRTQNSFAVTRNLQMDAGMSYTQLTDGNGHNIQYNYLSPHGNKALYPYAKLSDQQGHPLPVNLDYGSAYLQQAGQLGFPSWAFYPLDDLHAEDHQVKTRDFLLTTGVRYKIIPSLNLEFKYQLEDQHVEKQDNYLKNSYYVRDLVNSFVQVGPTSYHLSYPIPPAGGIQDIDNREMVANQGRMQLNYSNQQRKWHELDVIAGYEIKSQVTTGISNRNYGYDPNRTSVIPSLDYSTPFQQYLTYSAGTTIPNPGGAVRLTDHYLSMYGNASYSFHSLYNLFGSIRKDQANLFGVNTNKKGIPLWSTGVGWQLSNLDLYPFNWLPYLKLRSTYGRSGNVARLASAYTTAFSTSGGLSGSPYTQLTIQSPPNSNLTWEQVEQWNFGMDFATKGRRLSGTIEYYRKHATNLLALISADPTLGLTQSAGTAGTYYGNSASIKGKGVDLLLETINFNGDFRWTTNILYSYSMSIVDRYLIPPALGNRYLDQYAINPVAGKPVLGVYSFRTPGLDPQTGDPRGWSGGKSSTDWNGLFNNTRQDSMQFSGPTQPTSFGSIRNTFSWSHFTLSTIISYQFGHYFRIPGLSYSDLANTWRGSSSYTRRWQHPGDEKQTHVPSLKFPLDEFRDNFYLFSNALVRKADQIRWEDINLSYELSKDRCRRLPFNDIRFFGYVSGLGVIWTANKEGLDPYFINVPRDRPRYTIGMTIHFLNLNHQP